MGRQDEEVEESIRLAAEASESQAVLIPPAPQVLERAGALRWFVGDPSGARSSTWSVVGSSTSPEAYFSSRAMMSSIKLSIHVSMTRLAHTREWWQKYAIDPDADRLIRRWASATQLAPGWRRVLQLLIPNSSLVPAQPEKNPKDGNLSCFPSPGEGCGMQFEVLLPDADAPDLKVLDVIGEVGRMPLGGQSSLWVVATVFPVDANMESTLASMRQNALAVEENPNASPEMIRSWAWGSLDVDGTPSVIDLGCPTAKGDHAESEG